MASLVVNVMNPTDSFSAALHPLLLPPLLPHLRLRQLLRFHLRAQSALRERIASLDYHHLVLSKQILSGQIDLAQLSNVTLNLALHLRKNLATHIVEVQEALGREAQEALGREVQEGGRRHLSHPLRRARTRP